MVSTTSWILFGIIALVAVVVIWKWWKKPVDESKKNDDVESSKLQTITEDEETGPPPDTSLATAEPPPMVFAVNDDGNFDLTDMAGKILNIGFGPNPKTYINLLDQSEKDTVKDDTTGKMTSTVGTTKLYQVGGRPYIVNFTRL